MYFFQKNIFKKIKGVPTLPKIFRPVTQNTLISLFGQSKHSVLTHNLDPLGHSWVGSKGHPQSCLTLIGDNIPEMIFSKKFILEKYQHKLAMIFSM